MLYMYCVFLPLECNQNRFFFVLFCFTVLFTGVCQVPKQCLVPGGHSLTKYLYNEWIGKPSSQMAGGNTVISQCNLVFRKCFLWARAKFHCSLEHRTFFLKFQKPRGQSSLVYHLPCQFYIWLLLQLYSSTSHAWFTRRLCHPNVHAEAYEDKVCKYPENWTSQKSRLCGS